MKDKAESGGGNSPPVMADGRKRKRLDTELIHDSEGSSRHTPSLLPSPLACLTHVGMEAPMGFFDDDCVAVLLLYEDTDDCVFL